jgi:hypothetical protein
MRIVVDTSALVSVLLWRGAPYRCLLAIQAGIADLVFSILNELQTVLLKKLRQTPVTAQEFVTFIRYLTLLVYIPGFAGRVEEAQCMRATVGPATGRHYPRAVICRAYRLPRSTVYSGTAAPLSRQEDMARRRRSPTPRCSRRSGAAPPVLPW